MQININTDDLTQRSATALMMMLMSLYPQDVGVPAIGGDFERRWFSRSDGEPRPKAR